LELFTPCFSRYIVLDRQAYQFVIKDTQNNKEIAKIPKDYISFSDKNGAFDAMNRFKWLDGNTFKYINLEGVEKIFNVDGGFVEMEHNVRPIFKETYQVYDASKDDNGDEVYFARIGLGREDTVRRLKISYQQYTSAYYLDKKRF
jgi:hypothetical protein